MLLTTKLYVFGGGGGGGGGEFLCMSVISKHIHWVDGRRNPENFSTTSSVYCLAYADQWTVSTLVYAMI